MKTVILAGEVYSQNVGDQAIHACLKYILKEQNPELQVLSLDISGREVPVESEAPRTKNKLVGLINAWSGRGKRKAAMNLAYHRLLAQRKYEQMWSPLFEQADGLVIGGGQLLMDNDLDFPLKLSCLADLAKARRLPVHITACGVGKTWTSQARGLFQPVIEQAASITLRDGLSRGRLVSFLPGTTCQVTADPAILAAEIFTRRSSASQAERVGLGVMSREDANSRLPEKVQFTEDGWKNLWLDIMTGLVEENMKVEIFTTGSQPDDDFARELFFSFDPKRRTSISQAVRPGGVKGLLGIMRGFTVVIATRLHASILANALGISSLGLGWDEKVQAYYNESSLPERCFNLEGLEPEKLVRDCRELNSQPFSQILLSELKYRARLNGQVILETVQ
jgi:polysaccharide pyruvyl transferase WcaK-like protein